MTRVGQTEELVRPGVVARVVYTEPEGTLLVEDVSAALYDFSILYEVALLGGADNYSRVRGASSYQGPWFWTRSARRIEPAHKLRILTINRKSPLETLVAIPAAVLALGGGFWAIVQAWERILDRPVSREKLHADARRSFYEAERAQLDYEDRLRERGIDELEGRARRRVKRNAIRPQSIELEP